MCSKSLQRCSYFPIAIGMQLLGRQQVSPWEEPVPHTGNPQAHSWSQAWGCQDKEGPTGHPKQSPTILFNVRRAFLITATLIQRAAVSQTHSDASGVSSGPKTRQSLPPLPAACLFAWCVVTLSLNLQDFPSQHSHSGCKLRGNSWDSGVSMC